MSAQQIQRNVATPGGGKGATGLCPNPFIGSTITPPADLVSQNGLLEVTLNLNTDVDSAGRQRYCYVTDTGLISPTLRVNPGDTLLIHFFNQLPVGLVPAVPMVMPAMPGMPAMSSISSSSTSAKSTLAAGLEFALDPKNSTAKAAATPALCNGGAMSDSVSNIHFHGLNVSPACGSDEVVYTLVQPGKEFDYTIQIPTNEPSGLYWYHPHPHGFSEGQVLGGATGAIVVQGIEQSFGALYGMPEQVFVIRDQLTPVSTQSLDNVPAWDLSLDYVPVAFPAYTPAVISVAPFQYQLWRVVNSSADTILDLEYDINGRAQNVTVVAIDGVPVTGSYYQTTNVLMGPGSRAEFVVLTPNIGASAQLVTNAVDTGPDGDNDPDRPIANIVASTSAPTLRVLPAIKQPKAKSAARFAALPAAAPTIPTRNLYFSETLLDPTDPNSPTNFFITQQGQTPQVYTMGQAPSIVVHSGTVETWVIQNQALENHVFHIHQIHFQVLAVNGVPVNDPAIRDTYVIPYWDGESATFPSVTVAMDFRDPNIIGTFVYHCHILGHEDGGMMAAIQVLPAGVGATIALTPATGATTPGTPGLLTGTVTPNTVGATTPTGQVQLLYNGTDIGNPITLTKGVASVPALGALLPTGTSTLQAFYMGDNNYNESLSNQVTVTNAPFGLIGTPTTAAIGAAASANVQVAVATNYLGTVTLTCTMPSTLTESACFVNPTTVMGGGAVTLTVNTTPPHLTSRQSGGLGIRSAAATGLAALLIPFLRRKRRWDALKSMLAVAVMGAFLLAFSGCSGSGVKDAGTLAGTYNVTITGSGPYGATTYTTTTVVPVTVH